jgi:hypothetical protein
MELILPSYCYSEHLDSVASETLGSALGSTKGSTITIDYFFVGAEAVGV